MEALINNKTAFVFAGGGSFGAIQVGMLQALVAHGVRPDFVVGSSVGAINGAYFAGNPTLEGVAQLRQLWCELKRSTVFPMNFRRIAGLFLRSTSLVDSSGLRALIERQLPYSLLEQAALPLHVVATSQLHGQSVCLSSGPAVDAILASCAIPAIFPPVHLGGEYLIDGAIVGNTPIATAVRLGASRLIVLPTGYACALTAPPASAMGSALHALNMLIAHQLVQDLELLDDRFEVLTVPPLCPLSASAYDFSRAAELIDRAEKNTRQWLEGGGLGRHGIPQALRPHVD